MPRTSAARRSFSRKLFHAAKRKLYTSGRAGSIRPDGAAGGRGLVSSAGTGSFPRRASGEVTGPTVNARE